MMQIYPIEMSHRTLDESFGPQWSDSLELDPEPIGSGCIAQVYQGVLKPYKNCKPSEMIRVAVKIIHPEVENVVKIDMEILRFCAKMINSIAHFEALSLPETMEIFAKVAYIYSIQ